MDIKYKLGEKVLVESGYSNTGFLVDEISSIHIDNTGVTYSCRHGGRYIEDSITKDLEKVKMTASLRIAKLQLDCNAEIALIEKKIREEKWGEVCT